MDKDGQRCTKDGQRCYIDVQRGCKDTQRRTTVDKDGQRWIKMDKDVQRWAGMDRDGHIYAKFMIGVRGCAPRNGLFHSCACGRVAGVVQLLGSAGRLGFIVRFDFGSVFFEVRFGGRGPHGCVLLIEIYKVSHRT